MGKDRILPSISPAEQALSDSRPAPEGACLTNAYPFASAGPNQGALTGAIVHFSALASYDPDGRPLTSYFWNFGDGSLMRGAQVSHVYTEPGTYTVRVTVFDDCRTSGTDVAIVLIGGDDPCFGNAAPTANAGPDQQATPGQLLAFSGSGSQDPEGAIDLYEWEFGDNTFGIGPSASHAYGQPGTYVVWLTVTDDCGDVAEDSMTVIVANADPCANNLNPVASAGASRTVQPNTAELFSATGSHDPSPGGFIQTYAWNFGDGSSAGGHTVSHAFANPGTYTVTLAVTDNCGGRSTASVVITVAAPPNPCTNDPPPTANAGPDKTGTAGTAVSLDGRGSSDNGTIMSYSWNFGDGVPGSGSVVAHTYVTAGTYTATLTVTDNCGRSSSDTVRVTVNNPAGGGLNANFTVAPGAPRVQEVVTFTAAAAAQAGQFFFYWNFGDGVAGFGTPVTTRIFEDPGPYTVSLTVYNNQTWASTSITRQFVVDEGLELTGMLHGSLTWNVGVAVVGTTAWVVGSPEGLVTANISDPSEPRFLDHTPLGGAAYDVAASSRVVAVVAAGVVRLYNPDIPANHTPLSSPISVSGFGALGAAIDGDYLYVTGGWSGLRVYNVANRSSPQLVGSLVNAGYLKEILVEQGYAYVADGSLPGVRIVDVRNPAAPSLLAGRVMTTGSPVDFDLDGNRLAVAETYSGLELFDVSNRANPVRLGSALSNNLVSSVLLRGNSAFVGYINGVAELDISNAAQPRLLSVVPLNYEAGEIKAYGDYLVVGFKQGVVGLLHP